MPVLMTPHPFNSGGASGIPDRPCVTGGKPDRDPIHAKSLTRESLIQLDGLLLAFARALDSTMAAAVVRMVREWATEAWRKMPTD